MIVMGEIDAVVVWVGHVTGWNNGVTLLILQSVIRRH